MSEWFTDTVNTFNVKNNNICEVRFQRHVDPENITSILLGSVRLSARERALSSRPFWFSKRNPGGLDFANGCPEYSCPKLWRIKKSLFAVVANSSGEPRFGSPMNEGHSFHSSLGATLRQKPKPKWNKAPQPVLTCRRERSANETFTFETARALTKKKKAKKKHTQTHQRSDCEESSFISCKALRKDR